MTPYGCAGRPCFVGGTRAGAAHAGAAERASTRGFADHVSAESLGSVWPSKPVSLRRRTLGDLLAKRRVGHSYRSGCRKPVITSRRSQPLPLIHCTGTTH